MIRLPQVKPWACKSVAKDLKGVKHVSSTEQGENVKAGLGG